MDLRPGDTLLCVAKRDKLILKNRVLIEKELWACFARVQKSLAKELIRERRLGSGRKLEL